MMMLLFGGPFSEKGVEVTGNKDHYFVPDEKSILHRYDVVRQINDQWMVAKYHRLDKPDKSDKISID